MISMTIFLTENDLQFLYPVCDEQQMPDEPIPAGRSSGSNI